MSEKFITGRPIHPHLDHCKDDRPQEKTVLCVTHMNLQEVSTRRWNTAVSLSIPEVSEFSTLGRFVWLGNF